MSLNIDKQAQSMQNFRLQFCDNQSKFLMYCIYYITTNLSIWGSIYDWVPLERKDSLKRKKEEKNRQKIVWVRHPPTPTRGHSDLVPFLARVLLRCLLIIVGFPSPKGTTSLVILSNTSTKPQNLKKDEDYYGHTF